MSASEVHMTPEQIRFQAETRRRAREVYRRLSRLRGCECVDCDRARRVSLARRWWLAAVLAVALALLLSSCAPEPVPCVCSCPPLSVATIAGPVVVRAGHVDGAALTLELGSAGHVTVAVEPGTGRRWAMLPVGSWK